MKAVYILLALLFCSCSIEHKIARKLRRADKLIKEAKALGAETRSDTVFTDRVLIIPGDSIVIEKKVVEMRDTTIYKERVKLRIRVDSVKIQIAAECIPDTIKIKVPFTVTEKIECPPVPSFWRYLALALLVVCAVLLYFRK